MKTEEKQSKVINLQKFKWNRKQTFSDYQSASKLKSTLLEEGYLHVKIKRCGSEGKEFKVIVGTLVKANKKVNNKNLNTKENSNAN